MEIIGQTGADLPQHVNYASYTSSQTYLCHEKDDSLPLPVSQLGSGRGPCLRQGAAQPRERHHPPCCSLTDPLRLVKGQFVHNCSQKTHGNSNNSHTARIY